jgi:hypothetical protein
MWINRLQFDKLLNAVASRPVVLLTGARQTGKSSLLQKSYPSYQYVSLDNTRASTAAQENPEQFLSTLSTPVIIDEIQYAPGMLRALKVLVDQNRQQYGNWLLTGSQQFHLMQGISESLAGRIAILHLETLSAKELRQSNAKNIVDAIWRGGYPELWAEPSISAELFFDGYLQTYIERDLRSIVEVNNLADFQRFLRMLASRCAQLVNYRDLSRDVGVSDATIRRWLHALEIGGVIYLLPPYYANIGKRLVKSPKIYFADQGLLCYLLGVQNETNYKNHILKGQLWENFVFTEIIKTTGKQAGKDLFFYRDQSGVEVDFVIEDSQGLHFIETKSDTNGASFKSNIAKVAPLFKKQNTHAYLFANIPEQTSYKIKNHLLLNPLWTDVPF